MTELLAIETHFVGDYSRCPVQIPAISISEFRRIIKTVSSTYEPVTRKQISAFFTDGKPLPERCFHFTCDDGIRDHVTNVLPILKENGLDATFFVPGSIFAEDGRLPLLEKQRFLQYAYGDYVSFLTTFIHHIAATCAHRSLDDIENTPENMAKGYVDLYEKILAQTNFNNSVEG